MPTPLPSSRRPLALLLAALALPLAGCPFTGGSGVLPTNESCSTPTAGAALEGLELGRGGSGAFEPLADGDVIVPERGGQGAQMLTVRLRASGTGAPACLDEVLEVRQGGQRIAYLDQPLTTYADGAARTTRTIYLILYGYAPAGEPVVIEANAGGKRVARALWVSVRGDGGLPSTTSDGGAAAGDGG